MAIKVNRISVPDATADYEIPNGVDWLIICNEGPNPVRICGEGQDIATTYWEIAVGQETPVMRVVPGQKFKGDGVDGASTVQILMW